MQPRHWHSLIFVAMIGLIGVAASLSRPVSAQAPDSRPTTSSQQTANKLNADAPLVFPKSASSMVLYDQLNNAGATDVTSQNFEASKDAFDDFAADDFVVPDGQSWNIDTVEVAGEYVGGPATSVNVFFYSNAITLPGTLLAARTNLSYTTVLTPGNFAIPLSPTVRLNAGTYWISVQVNQDFTPNGQWFWRNRTVKTNSAAAWENPGNGFGTGCTSWGTRSTTCALSPADPDQVFRLSGTLLGCPADPIFNGGFETGSFAPWVIDGTANTPVVTTTQPHIGINSALLGTLSGAEPLGNSSFYQQIAVPPAGGLLNFWYRPFTTDVVSFDWQDAYVTDLSGTILATIFHQASNSQIWTNQTFDLTPWAGQTVRIKFLVHEDGFGDDTAMYVDDVSLNVPCACSFGVPSPWVLRNNLPLPVYEANVTNNGIYAYAIGGYSVQAGADVTQTVRYNPVADNFTALTPVPGAVSMASAVFAPINNKLYVFGGGLAGTGQVFTTTRIYDIVGNSWTTGAPMPGARQFMASGYYNGKIYLVGGYSTGSVTSAFAQTWEYNVQANTWITKTNMPQALGGAGSAVVNGHLYIIGGRFPDNTISNQTYDYDIAGNTWFTRTNIPAGVNVPGAAVVAGRILVPGGGTPFRPVIGQSQLANVATPETTNATWIYDPAGNSWSVGPSLNIARSFPGVTGFSNLAIAMGGYDGSTSTGTTEMSWMCPTNVAFSAPTYSVNENGGSATITVTLEAASPFTATVNFATSDGTATAGSDYIASSGTLTFTPGVTSRTFTVPIIDDTLFEENETVNLSLSNATGAALGATNPATLTIVNSSPPPTVQFSAATYSMNENAGAATITVTLNAVSSLTATVDFATSNGTATAGSDYITSSGTLTFTPGVTSQTFNVPIIDDSLFEENETVNLSLSGATNATLGAPSFAVVTIVDNNDPPPPLVCGSGGPGSWVLRNFAPIPVYASSVGNDGASAYVVGGYSIQTGGDVTQTMRYNPVTNVWSPLAPVPDAVSMASVVYAPINNKLYVFGGELIGTFQVFSTTRIYDVGSNSWSTGTPMPDLRDFMGGGYYNGKIYLVGGYSTGSVTPAYSQTWEYDVLANTWVTKTAMPRALGGPASAVVNGHLYVIGGRDGSTSAITQTYDYDIAGNTWFTRTAIPTGVNVPGTAVLGGKVWVIGGGSPFLALDNQSQPSSINAPETFSTTQIYDPIGNSWSAGPNLNVQRSFVGATGFGNFAIAIGGYNGSTTTGATEVTQNCPSVQLSASTYSVSESVGTASITATLDTVSGVTATVVFSTTSGTATAGSDYTGVTGALIFAPGQTSRTFSVPILNDALVEPPETFTATLSSPSNATLGAPNSASVTITDNDTYPTVRFNASGYFVNENAGTATITVTLSASYPLTATVSYATSDGTAIAGSDYTASSGTLTFTPGQTSLTFTVPISNDILKEPNETVNLTLSNAINAILGLPNPATLTIIDSSYNVFLPIVLRN